MCSLLFHRTNLTFFDALNNFDLVYFCPFYAAVRNEGKMRTEGFEQAKCLLEKIASFCDKLLLISTRCAIMGIKKKLLSVFVV